MFVVVLLLVNGKDLIEKSMMRPQLEPYVAMNQLSTVDTRLAAHLQQISYEKNDSCDLADMNRVGQQMGIACAFQRVIEGTRDE